MLALALALLAPADAAPALDPGALPADDVGGAPIVAPGVRDTGLPADVFPDQDGRVVGGRAVDPGTWPDAAFVWLGDGLCTGTLIHPRWVLTAGHCVEGAGPSQVVLGATSFRDLQGDGGREVVTRAVKRSIAHPAYGASYLGGHDIALVELDAPVTTIPPRTIARDCVVDEALRNGARVVVVGWGSTDTQGDGFNATLNAGTTRVQSEDCRDDVIDGMYSGCDPEARPAGELGAGGHADACFGDSGGPLYLETDAGTWLVGVTSRAYLGVPRNEPCGHGGIYTRPDAVLGWIERQIGEALPRPVCTAPPEVEVEPVLARPGGRERVVLHVEDDGEAWTVSVKEEPAHGRLELDAGKVVYVADREFEGDDAFVLTVTDDGSEDYPGTPPASVDVVVEATVAAGCGGCAAGGGGGAYGLLGIVGVLAVRRRR